jgi:imidazolonepropionase-like amidohydrolase
MNNAADIDLVVAGGTVVLPDGPRKADVLVSSERIAGVVDAGEGRGREVVDATGKIVLPAGVDPHVHLMVGFMGQRSVYDFETGRIAALRGGTTAIVDFALQRRGGSMRRASPAQAGPRRRHARLWPAHDRHRRQSRQPGRTRRAEGGGRALAEGLYRL